MTYHQCFIQEIKWLWIPALLTVTLHAIHTNHLYISVYIVGALLGISFFACIRYMRNGKSLIE
jgi:hypothetical protein